MNKFNKIFVIIVVALMASGCATVPTVAAPSGTQRIIFLQVGVMLQVFNNCSTTPGRLYPSTGGEVLVPAGRPTYVPMASMPLMATRSLSATYQVFEGDVMVGSISRSFYIDRYQGTQTVQWVIGGDGYGGGRDVVNERCPRPIVR